MANVDLCCLDVMEWARTYKGPKFHAMLCDPPYHLVSVEKRFGNSNIEDESFVNDNQSVQGMARFAKSQRGFMGKKWDGGDIAFNPETWAALGEHLYDGAFIMAFASSRGWHRLAVAIEDAGFVFHPSVFLYGFCYGSGFPKATRIDRSNTKKGVGERDTSNSLAGGYALKNRCPDCGKPFFSGNPCQCPKPKSEHPFAGHRYGLQAMKPALEPVIVAQKPYKGKPIECITQTGAGALWIDGGRVVAGEGDYNGPDGRPGGAEPGNGGTMGDGWHNKLTRQSPNVDGRWPANFILMDDEAAAALDAQSGHSKTNRITKPVVCDEEANTWGGTFQRNRGERGYDDEGGASRFFFRVQEQIDEADPVFYTAKASRRERDSGLEELPLRERGQRYGLDVGGTLAQQTPHKHEPQRNPHPTLKPLSLAKYLATLLLPPSEYAPRRILVPFAGTASECIGAAQAGWEEIVGIEREEEYVEIAKARVKYWTEKQLHMELV